MFKARKKPVRQKNFRQLKKRILKIRRRRFPSLGQPDSEKSALRKTKRLNNIK